MPGTPRAGELPGTERWLVFLRGRDHAAWRDRVAAIRAEPALARRRTMAANLPAQARAEQDAFARGVAEIGGRVVAHHWTFHVCTVDIPREKLLRLRSLLGAGVVHPVQPREPASGSGARLPMNFATNADNHNTAGAYALIAHHGAGAYFALFDTGVDEDQSGTGTGATYGPDPELHRAFAGRMIFQQRVGNIDCNSIPPDPWSPAAVGNPYPNAKHGTGVAGIAVGSADAGGQFFAGHADGAGLLSFSFAYKDPTSPSSTTWTTDESLYLAAVDALRAWILAEKDVQVLNISFDGYSDPQNPSQLALDLLEREHDVLVTTSAANDFDATFTSNGYVNGLSVGNVHKWGSSLGRYPDRSSSRGPLFGDRGRYYPDVVATGSAGGASTSELVQQIQMPLIDDKYTPTVFPPWRGAGLGQQNYNSRGTSMAAPQVAGAAVLYRAERPPATALETKAAVLLTTIDPLAGSTTYGALASRNTYEDRNMMGEGYVRDDLLIRYATRLDDAQGWSVTVSPAAPTITLTLPTPVTDGVYAVAIAWPRVFESDFDPAAGVPAEWANVDLEVRTPGPGNTGILLARSDSPRNTYERGVFQAQGSVAEIRLTGVELHGQAVPVFVAARRVTSVNLSGAGSVTSKVSVPGFVHEIPQEVGCARSVPNETVVRVLPAAYEQAWGSQPKETSTLSSTEDYWGAFLCAPGQAPIIDTIFAPSELGTATLTVRGLALRTWSGLKGGVSPTAGSLVIESIWLYSRPYAGGSLAGLLATFNGGTNPPNGGTQVVSNLTVPVHAPAWNARDWSTWSVVIPFNLAPFTIAPGNALGVWIRTATTSTATQFVDAVADLGSVTSASNLNSGVSATRDGRALVIGLLEAPTQTVRSILDVYGFPRIGEELLFQVRSAGPGATVVVELGFSSPGNMIGACRRLTSGDFTPPSLPSVTTALLGDASVPFTIPNDPVLLHRHVFAQAAVTVGGTTTYTNGARLTVGGVLP